MKTVLSLGVIFGVLVLSVVGWDKFDDECVTKLKLDKEEIKKLDDRTILTTDNKAFNDFVVCSWQTEGSVTQNGDIDWDKIVALLDEYAKEEYEETKSKDVATIKAILLEALKKCKQSYVKGSSAAETIVNVHNCLYEKL